MMRRYNCIHGRDRLKKTFFFWLIYDNTFEHLEEMNDFLVKYELKIPTQEETKTLKRPKTLKQVGKINKVLYVKRHHYFQGQPKML